MSEESHTSESHDDVHEKVLKDVYRNLKISFGNSSTIIVVIAVSNDDSKNFLNRVSCRKGIPLSGYVFDVQTDSYIVECADFLNLGSIPYTFVATQKDKKEWKTFVPMPESVIKKCLSDFQKNELKKFKSHFKSNDYRIEFIQMIDPNL